MILATPPEAELAGLAEPRRLRGRAAGTADRLPQLVSIRRYIACLAFLDAVVATLSSLIGLHLRLGVIQQGGTYLLVIAVMPPLWIVILLSCRCYDRCSLVVGPEECRRITTAGLWLFACVAISSYATHADLSRGVVAMTTPLIIALTLVARLAARRLLHLRLLNGRAIYRVVVAGSIEQVRDLVRHMRRAPRAGFSCVGVCVPDELAELDLPGGVVPVLGSVGEVAEATRRVGADTIAIASSNTLPAGELRRLSWELEGTGVNLLVAPAITDLAGPRILVRPIDGLPILHIREPVFAGGQRVVKEVIDRAAAAALILVLSPLLLGIVVAVRLGGRGSVLFRQVRVGYLGREFVLWKFRSMREGAELERDALLHLNEQDGPLFKMRGDPRITGVGRWLRRHSLDELPQLWNVVSGSMSLVGPRPPLPAEADRYPTDAMRRLLVKPGITGLWQVSGRSDLSWEETVRLDLYYVENWSVAMDLMLLWKTISIVVRGAGAY